ncbi:DUF6557 family protein [Rossellomorea marisflavi]|uniref:DUF6557 family protein n=1 Tax=Rossellomorea marisflavi TaxID=189381 RepID=UPI003FA00BAB
MNVYEWLFSDKGDLKKAVETLKTLFYNQKDDGEWRKIELGYESTILELEKKTPTTKYQYAKLQIRPESPGEEVYCEVYATDDGRSFGIDFIPWADVLGMNVEMFRKHDVSKQELIAHFLLELTFDGFIEQDMEVSHRELIERVKKAEDVDSLNPLES